MQICEQMTGMVVGKRPVRAGAYIALVWLRTPPHQLGGNAKPGRPSHCTGLMHQHTFDNTKHGGAVGDRLVAEVVRLLCTGAFDARQLVDGRARLARWRWPLDILAARAVVLA